MIIKSQNTYSQEIDINIFYNLLLFSIRSSISSGVRDFSRMKGELDLERNRAVCSTREVTYDLHTRLNPTVYLPFFWYW